MAFSVLAFGYPCLVLPIGTYTMKATENTSISYTFKFNGKVEMATKIKETETKKEYFYKLDWKRGVIISEDDKFDDKDMTLKISSINSVGGADNPIAMAISIGVAVLDLVLVLTIRKKRS